MQPSLLNNPPQKVKNILIRHSCSKEVRLDSPFQSPEIFHLLKYAPKYYKTLSLEVTKENRLQSKIKKIKKLKSFKGYFKQILPSKLWLNLLANTRKEIEEIPQIKAIRSNVQPSPTFWARLTLWKVKFFPNITSLFLPRRQHSSIIQDYDDISLVKKPFMGYLRNMRKIKTLKMFPDEADNEGGKWMRGKLNGMSQCLSRLEKVALLLSFGNLNIQEELLKNKDLFAHLTSLTFSPSLKILTFSPSLKSVTFSPSLKFDKDLVMLLQTCKNLTFLLVNLRWNVNIPEFLEFLTSIQSLSHLLGLELDIPKGLKKYWTFFKPQTSLRSLKLKLDVADLTESGIQTKDLLKHWEEIEELDQLEFGASCKTINDLTLLRQFTTLVLSKVRKLKSFKCSLYLDFRPSNSILIVEPVFVEEVSHLHASLQALEYTVRNANRNEIPLEFDMKQMGVLKNLREFKLNGDGLCQLQNIEEIVSVLEEGQKEADLPTLKLHLELVDSSNWLKEALEIIKRIKRPDKNLKVELDFKIRIRENELGFLDELCQVLQSVGFIKGLLVCFWFFDPSYIGPISIQKLKELTSKYGEVRNLVVKFGYLLSCFEYRKIDGEKEQFF